MSPFTQLRIALSAALAIAAVAVAASSSEWGPQVEMSRGPCVAQATSVPVDALNLIASYEGTSCRAVMS